MGDMVPIIGRAFPNKEIPEMRRNIERAIAEAATHEITLTPGDFRIIDGDVYLDGMDPFDWIHAMTMD